MSYVISSSQHFALLLGDDDDIKKDVLQKIFELLVDGYSFHRNATKEFTQHLESLVASSSPKVRKWAYHCACIHQNDLIVKTCIDNLHFETNIENIIWALTALSIRYDNLEDLKSVVPSNRHDEFVSSISPNYLEDALYLFGNATRIDINPMFAQNYAADLAVLAKIYGYAALSKSDDSNINADVISDMINHSDPYVREYAFWALYRGGSENRYLNSGSDSDLGARKWQIAIQIESGDIDFITATLKPLSSNPNSIDKEIKEGIIKGLEKSEYQSAYVPYVYRWFTLEDIELVVCLLIDYMLINCSVNRENGTYFEAIRETLSAEDSYAEYVERKIRGNKKFGLKLSSAPPVTIDFVERSNVMANINITNSKITNSPVGAVNSEISVDIGGDSLVDSNKSDSSFSNEIQNAISQIAQIEELTKEQKEYLAKLLDETNDVVQRNDVANQKTCKDKFQAFMFGIGNISTKVVGILSGLANLAKFFGLPTP